jgi:predicted amidohydrolase
MRVAAIQLETRLADVAANLEACERLADDAAGAGAEWIALPEFFTTGVAFDERLADAALAPDGAAFELMRSLATRHGATVGGSFLARDDDGHVRNAYLLIGPGGELLGRHDKDLPTMWENAFYVDGEPGDDGVIETGELCAGAAVCWELMRSQTARRLRGRVDLVTGGSCWWSIPELPPRAMTRRLEVPNARTASIVAERFARMVGAPVVHAAHSGRFESAMPWMPLRYRGYFEGGALVCDASGRVLDRRDRRDGAGFAIADVEPRRVPPLDPVPDSYWLHRRGAVPAAAWTMQRLHGRRWYRRNVYGRPPATVRANRAPSMAPARHASR